MNQTADLQHLLSCCPSTTVERAAQQHRPGPHQLQAAIVACRAQADNWDDRDWEQILLLCDMLLHLAPSPITRLHRAIALRYVVGAQAALVELEPSRANSTCITAITPRAEFLRALGHPYQVDLKGNAG